MMFRSGWGTKEGQESILAVRIQRAAFDTLLEKAVYSHFSPELYANEETWKDAIEHSEVRLQWDPDHDPSGASLERRAIQLGLRGAVLVSYAREWIVSIEDITSFVHEQYQQLLSHDEVQLVTPREEIYPVQDEVVARQSGLSFMHHS